MSLAKFLKDGNLTDFLKGELIATSPSPTSAPISLPVSAPISPPASAPISPPASPVRDLKAKTDSLIQEATQNIESTINQKLNDAEQKLNKTFAETTKKKLDDVEKQMNMQVAKTLKDALNIETEVEEKSIYSDSAAWNLTKLISKYFEK